MKIEIVLCIIAIIVFIIFFVQRRQYEKFTTDSIPVIIKNTKAALQKYGKNITYTEFKELYPHLNPILFYDLRKIWS